MGGKPRMKTPELHGGKRIRLILTAAKGGIIVYVDEAVPSNRSLAPIGFWNRLRFLYVKKVCP
jgi:hypothetical protein